MYELTINEQVYQFRFGFGFLKAIDKTASMPIDNIDGVRKNVGLRLAVAGLIDGDVMQLVDVLDTANKAEKPRLTRAALESYIEDPETNIDGIFTDVLGFLRTSNCTKNVVQELEEAVEAEKAKQEAKEAAESEN